MRPSSGGKSVGRFQRIAGRNKPPDLIELQPFHRRFGGDAMAVMGRVKRASHHADALPRKTERGLTRREPKLCCGIFRVNSEVPLRASSLRPDLAVAAHLVLEARQLLDADRAARVHLAGCDADLAAEAEFAAIGELRRGVDEDDGRVDSIEEAFAAASSSVMMASVCCEP